jgi:hypothetical protein
MLHVKIITGSSFLPRLNRILNAPYLSIDIKQMAIDCFYVLGYALVLLFLSFAYLDSVLQVFISLLIIFGIYVVPAQSYPASYIIGILFCQSMQ